MFNEDFFIPVYIVDASGQASEIFNLEIKVCENEEECESFDTFVLNLQYGNNFVSFPVLPNDKSTLNVLNNIADNVNFITSQGIALFHNLEENSWSGNLNVIDYNKGYWINVNSAVDLYLVGQKINSELNYELDYGNNKISYPLESCRPISDVFSEEIESKIKFILGQGIGNFHNDENEDGILGPNEWVGNLNTLCPGKGYDINVLEPLDLVFIDSVEQSPTQENILTSFFKKFFRNI